MFGNDHKSMAVDSRVLLNLECSGLDVARMASGRMNKASQFEKLSCAELYLVINVVVILYIISSAHVQV